MKRMKTITKVVQKFNRYNGHSHTWIDAYFAEGWLLRDIKVCPDSSGGCWTTFWFEQRVEAGQ